MTIDEDLRKIQGNVTRAVENTDRLRRTQTIYGIVTLLTLNMVLRMSCDLRNDQQRNDAKIQVQNVIGGPEPETFYIMNGQRAYLKIDGQPVDNLYSSEQLE